MMDVLAVGNIVFQTNSDGHILGVTFDEVSPGRRKEIIRSENLITTLKI